MERLLRRGLEQDYRERQEDSRSLRGRIDFQETTKRMLLRQGLANIISDELSPDTLELISQADKLLAIDKVVGHAFADNCGRCRVSP
jgi:5-methylcytosine-specific restriction endonuclease McrBC regulatory subunit McrC